MTGRELVLSAIKRQETKSIPWVPFIGCHAGVLIGKTADELLKDPELIAQAQEKAALLYNADGIPVSFDLQVEAEALGCELKWEKKNPPAVMTHILKSKKLKELRLPGHDDNRIGVMFEAARILRAKLPDTALYGLITGPFTLSLHLVGADLFMEMYDDPDYIRELMIFCADVAKSMADGYIEAGCDVIAMVDPMTSQIGPGQFLRFVTPYCTDIFEHIRRKGAFSSFFVCGDALKNLEVMCDCRPDNISVDENIPLDRVKTTCLERNVSFGGNLRLTTALLNGTPEQNAVHAYQCIKTAGSTGYILSPGCDIPYDVPKENLIAVAEVAKDEYKRQIAMELEKTGTDDDPDVFDMSDYGRTDKVIVDIITLDSEACAPCQYMVESVKNIMPQFDELVIWREHKIKSPKSVVFMTSLMVKNVPTICIDGQIKFVSVIPNRDELIEAIQDRINKKMKIRIKRRQAGITVIVDEGNDSEKTLENIKTAVMELGADISIDITKDIKIAESYGARELPAVILCVSQIKSFGKVPEVKIIKEWIKDLII